MQKITYLKKPLEGAELWVTIEKKWQDIVKCPS